MKEHRRKAAAERILAGEPVAEEVDELLRYVDELEQRLRLRTGIQTIASVQFEVETAEEQAEVLRRIERAVSEMQLDDDPDIDVHNVRVGVYNVRRQVPFEWLNPPENHPQG